MPAERWINIQAEKWTDRRTNRQRKEQTERHTRMLPLSQYSHKTHILGIYRLAEGKTMQTERRRHRQTKKGADRMTDRQRKNRQKDTSRCCIIRSWYSH